MVTTGLYVRAAIVMVMVTVAAAAPAQQAGPAAAPIPVREVTAPVATDSGMLRSATHVRGLSDGRVVVNDGTRRRLVLFDATLKAMTILADTAAGAAKPYGTRAALIAFTGDSTLLVDFDAQALVVIDPAGRFGRVMAPPKPTDLRFFSSSAYGVPGFDPKGRLVYRALRPPAAGGSLEGGVLPDGANKPVFTRIGSDSAPIVRSDFDSREIDTVALMRLPVSMSMTISPQVGRMVGVGVYNPLPVTDEWTLLPDGTIAVVRAQDYHIDWWDMGGKMTSTPKMPFDWKRISSEEKQALIDSLKHADSTRRANTPPPPPPPPGSPTPIYLPFTAVDAADLPDYYPPIRSGQVKSDREGNVWILPSTSSLSQGNLLGPLTNPTSGLVFDVVNRKGEIVERVKLPPGRNLAGFGPDATVYMIYAPAPGVIYLERARVAR